MTGESGKVANASSETASVVAKAAPRLEWVDAAKGWGIILVVIAHVWTRGGVRDSIYAFHMPLFFILSGYMSKPRAMAEFLPKQARAMLLPYAAFLVSLALFDWGFETWRGNHPIFHGWRDAAWRMAMGGSELRGPFTIFWFVPALFFGRLVWNAVALRWPDMRARAWIALVMLAVVGGVWIGARTDFAPLGWLAVPIVFAYLWSGALWRTLTDDKGLMRVCIAGALAMLALIWFAHMPPLNMKVGDYGLVWSPITLPLAFAGSVTLAGLARLWPARWLGTLGRMSLVIMYLHVAVIHYLSPYLPRPVLLVLAITVPVVANLLLERFAVTRKIFLGQN